jgi:hypothetical protein
MNMKAALTSAQTHNHHAYAWISEPSKADITNSKPESSYVLMDPSNAMEANTKQIPASLRKVVDRLISNMEKCKNDGDTNSLFFAIAYTPKIFTRADFGRIYHMTASHHGCHRGTIRLIRLLGQRRPDIASNDVKRFLKLIHSPDGALQLSKEMTWAFLPQDISNLIDYALLGNRQGDIALEALSNVLGERLDLLKYAVKDLEQKENGMSEASRIKKSAPLAEAWSKINSAIDRIQKQNI